MNNKTLADVFTGHDLEFMQNDLLGIKDELVSWLEGGEVDPESLEYIQMIFMSLSTHFPQENES